MTITGSSTSNAGGIVQGPAGGTGTYNGLLTFNTGSTLSPGGGQPGALLISGNNNLVMSSGSTYSVQITGSAPTTGYGNTTVTGAITLGGATLNANLTGFSPSSTQYYFILVHDGSSAISGTFNGLTNGSLLTVGSYTAKISYFGNFQTMLPTGGNSAVLYNFVSTPTPEPSCILGFLAFAALTAGMCRRFVRYRLLLNASRNAS
jgi:hypothetical protein